ncbi:hypothetical protein HUA74_44035 [Myxococcus sp. CA051A]|uniref:hypothetical protein n=1 Tax=Myxococcus sp. CA051A TaxID=2741739 RepID=UPI00157B3236|nr:hypothetical protein [Myxococcus sp. CA051A]NTX67640.1 hypothetical protein [Myxococcus sp. CA051A]
MKPENVIAVKVANAERALVQLGRDLRSAMPPGVESAVANFAVRIAHAETANNPHQRNRAIVEFVARLGLVATDDLVNRFVRNEGEDLFEATSRGDIILKRLALNNYLAMRPVVIDGLNWATAGTVRTGHGPAIDGIFAARKHARVGRHYFTRAVYVTPHAAASFNLPLPPTPRERFVEHHLKTVRALLEVEKSLTAQGYRVIAMKGEEALIRESFRANLTGRAGQGETRKAAEHYPDAQLVVESPEGQRTTINVEYVTSKYTDKMIASKAAAFSGPTVWAADRPGTARRIESLTGRSALLV